MEVQLLGPLEVVGPSGAARLGGPKERAVLAVLALSSNQVVPQASITDAVWGDDPPKSVTKVIQNRVLGLRKVLGRDNALPAIVTRPGGYELMADVEHLDLTRAEQLITQGRAATGRGNHDRASELLDQALALWRGPALAELGGLPFARSEIARLAELRLTVLEERISSDLARGRHAEVVAELDAAVATEPLRERLWSLRMLALHRSGRQAEALRAFQELRTFLAENLGLEPGPGITGLERAIVRRSPEIEWVRPAMPAGRVALLFTDVVGSTRLFQELGRDYRKVLERHEAVMRQAVTSHGGTIVRVTGDSIFAVFAEAGDAVAAALGSQLTLGDDCEQDDLSVRMGIHVGEAEPTSNDDYVELAVHLGERIAGAAHGGQVVLSDDAACATAGSLPAGSSLEDLGKYRLRGFDGSHRLHQLAHPRLEGRFPALRARAAGHNVPVDGTSFVGRHADLARGLALLRSTPLLTITGVEGVGKTRLARQLAIQVVADYPDGVWLAQLAPVREAAAVGRAIAAAAGVPDHQGPGAFDSIARHLADRSLVLVLDNCEHVLDAVARVSERLLACCPGLRILATSREPLRVAGEKVWVLPPLPVPDVADRTLDELLELDAVRLFVERAAQVAPGFELRSDNAGAIGRICCRVDGVPLAIERAAARLAYLSPQELALCLHDGF